VEGLTEFPVGNVEQFQAALESASKKRVTGSHAMNKESSRSHLVCILTLRQSRPQAGTRVFSKLHLIDLAGSEMVRKTNASGERMNEAKHINKSLSALGNVIKALVKATNSTAAAAAAVAEEEEEGEGENVGGVYFAVSASGNRKASGHIPYRDSKLTRLLQDSLGGNAKTVLVLAIAAHESHTQESINTMKFGERARLLSTKVRRPLFLLLPFRMCSRIHSFGI